MSLVPGGGSAWGEDIDYFTKRNPVGDRRNECVFFLAAGEATRNRVRKRVTGEPGDTPPGSREGNASVVTGARVQRKTSAITPDWDNTLMDCIALATNTHTHTHAERYPSLASGEPIRLAYLASSLASGRLSSFAEVE